MDVLPNSGVGLPVANAHFGKSFLPEWFDSQFPVGAESESSLDELNCPFNADFAAKREQQVKVVGYDDEFVQPVFSLGAIFVEDFEEQFRRAARLQEISFFVRGRGYEERARLGDNTQRIGTA